MLYRCVHPKDKALSIALTIGAFSAFALLPGPILFGYIFGKQINASHLNFKIFTLQCISLSEQMPPVSCGEQSVEERGIVGCTMANSFVTFSILQQQGSYLWVPYLIASYGTTSKSWICTMKTRI